MERVTVFTPTYNRAHTLWKCYESLCRQTCNDFCWLIVDDGSTDHTRQLVAGWQLQENPFRIIYVYKENGGLHTGYNAAIELLTTELAVCVDSDDYFTDTAIEEALSLWDSKKHDGLAGVCALCCLEDGQILGDAFMNTDTINLIDVMMNRRIRQGDRALLVRSDLYKSVAPLPTYNGEKNFNPHYMHLELIKKYDFLIQNKPLCVREYRADGMTKATFRQYLDSPLSFAQTRRLYMSFPGATFAFKARQAIRYTSSCIIAHTRKILYAHRPCRC